MTSFLTRVPLVIQPVCGGLPHILDSAQVELLAQIVDLIDLAFEVVKIDKHEDKFVWDPSWEKMVKITVLTTSSGTFKYRHTQQDLTGMYICGLLGEVRGCESSQYSSKSAKFRRLLNCIDFIYNYMVVFHESEKYSRGKPLNQQFLLRDFLSPIIPLLGVNVVEQVKLFKWLTTYPHAACRAYHGSPNELPNEPLVIHDILGEVRASEIVPWYLFQNQIGKRLKSLVKGRSSSKTIALVNSIAQTKRGCPTVPEEFVANALHDHKDAISTPFQIPKATPIEELKFGTDEARFQHSEYPTPYFRTYDEWITDLPNILEFILPGLLGKRGTLSPSDWKHCYPASTKACFEETGSKGGAREYLQRTIFEEFGFSHYSNHLFKMYDRRVGGAGEIRTSISVRDQDIMSFLWGRCLSFEGPCRSMTQSILEPLKVRIITKSQAIHQYLSVPFQKALHSALRKRNPFVLLGRPVGGDVIQDFVDRSLQAATEPGAWISGDYKGATDGLDQSLSEIVARKCLQYLAPWMEDAETNQILKNLVGQAINYAIDGEPYTVNQENGQLMGSILSFPILCIVNFLTYFCSQSELFHEYGRWYGGDRKHPLTPAEIDAQPVLINGDDYLCYASARQYEVWKNNLRFFGFKLSSGKNLVSDKFLMINSTLFVRSSRGSENFFSQVPYPNLGLLKGRSKVGSSEGMVDQKPLWTIAKDIEVGYPKDFSSLYRSWNKGTLDVYASDGQRNYYGPRELGFCGLYDPEASFTDVQRCYATAILRQLSEYGEQVRSPPGLRAVEQMKQSVVDTWNDCSRPQPKLGLYIPRMCPTPPGFTDQPVDREMQYHPFDGIGLEKKETIFYEGSPFPKVYIPVGEAISGRRALSLCDGFRFIRKNNVPRPLMEYRPEFDFGPKTGDTQSV